jgi:type II secretory pathway pseudopilin PulG
MLISSRHPTRRQRAGGFALVEIMVSATVLVIGVLSLVASVVASLRLVVVNREATLAHQAARAMCERMQDTNFAQIFATYNTDPADDPAGAGSATGANFAVPGLNAQKGDADGLPGAIEFPTISTGGTGVALDESSNDVGLGMPRDLSGDGVVGAGALAGGYMILPVRIRVRWRGLGGNQSLQITTLLISR